MFLEKFPLTNHRTLVPVNEINIILYSHLLYQNEPDDVAMFWKDYSYFDPTIVENRDRKFHFIELTKLRLDSKHFRKKLNTYLNVKFNPVNFYQPLEMNLIKFSLLAAESSIILQSILQRAALPAFVESVLAESEQVAETNDIIELIQIYKNSTDLRTRYEVLRKTSLGFLLGRVKNCLSFQKAPKYHKYLDRLFKSQLQLDNTRHIQDSFTLYYWLNPDDQIVFYDNETDAQTAYENDKRERDKKGKMIHPIQHETITPVVSLNGNIILRYISRIKNFNGQKDDYTSIIEKIVRKNLLYPNEITDIYGITFVVRGEKEILSLKTELEDSLGGTNTRKDEKKIQKAPISEYISQNSGEYFKIWKAIYDITLPHERLEIIMGQINNIKEDIQVLQQVIRNTPPQGETQKSLEFVQTYIQKKERELDHLKRIKMMYDNKSFDLQVEIQIQDLQSYLLSRCFGSSTEHAALKREQVLRSSLYKLYPKQIYEPFLMKLREKFLAKYIQRS
ncbi:MAG: hypothetical protein KBA26_12915 [Candidatus Delongbacteria bacterium]|nr:hypothetical protein [Candidatus Delongbacteria bacterium]